MVEKLLAAGADKEAKNEVIRDVREGSRGDTQLGFLVAYYPSAAVFDVMIFTCVDAQTGQILCLIWHSMVRPLGGVERAPISGDSHAQCIEKQVLMVSCFGG